MVFSAPRLHETGSSSSYPADRSADIPINDGTGKHRYQRHRDRENQADNPDKQRTAEATQKAQEPIGILDRRDRVHMDENHQAREKRIQHGPHAPGRESLQVSLRVRAQAATWIEGTNQRSKPI